jgi:NAD(P)-dependent dehydrogenase (short-subunit alcohol dehydrogenase family)
MELQGTVAIVTGGNGGLGQRICHALAQAGSHIAVVYTQSQAQAQEVAGQLRQMGVRAEAMACDVTHPQQVQQLVSQVVQTFGRVDILVNDNRTVQRVPCISPSSTCWWASRQAPATGGETAQRMAALSTGVDCGRDPTMVL